MRLPNPWVTVPVVLATLAGGLVGYLVTEASCSGRCAVPAVLIGLGVAIAVGLGVGIVVVLAVRSMREWREFQERDIAVFGEEPRRSEEPGPPTC